MTGNQKKKLTLEDMEIVTIKKTEGLTDFDPNDYYRDKKFMVEVIFEYVRSHQIKEAIEALEDHVEAVNKAQKDG